MLYWIPYAFVRISVFFIAGILAGIYAGDVIPFRVASALLIALCAAFFVIVFFNRHKGRLVFNPGACGLAAIFLAGYCNVYLNRDTNDDKHLVHHPEITYYAGVVSRYGQEKEKTFKEVISVQQTFNGHSWMVATGDVMVYLPKNDFPSGLNYGDRLIIKGSPSLVPEPANPGEFNYREYLAASNIYHQHFLSSATAKVFGNDPPSRLMDISISMRKWADAQMKKYVKGERERAIASALVLGVTDGLDNDLMGAYAATGSLHVLSVSGLHVGILYLVIMLLLKPMLRIRHGKWIVAGISLVTLWLYACVTGMSPSVLRAVAMFSFMVAARPLNLRTNIFNVLGASAFLLLLFNPFLILSIGFQLSYLAVAGIVYIHPLLYGQWEVNNRIGDEIWKISSVSIAAQLATLGLGLLYFHQFPNYFLLSNLYVLPLGFVILVGGLALLVVSFVEVIAYFVGAILEFVIYILNYLIFLTESIPFSVVSGIYITGFQCALLMCVIVFGILLIQFRKKWMIIPSALSLLFFALMSWIHFNDEVAPASVSVYKVSGSTAIDFFESGTVLQFLSEDTPPDKVSFHVQPNRVRKNATRVIDLQEMAIYQKHARKEVACWQGKTFLRITGDVDDLEPMKVDFLILSGNALKQWQDLPKGFSADLIIIDTSNSFRIADTLEKSKHEIGSNVHSIWHLGAFDQKI